MTHSNQHLSRTALIPHQLSVVSSVGHGVVRGGLLCIPEHLCGSLGVEVGDIFELRRAPRGRDTTSLHQIQHTSNSKWLPKPLHAHPCWLACFPPPHSLPLAHKSSAISWFVLIFFPLLVCICYFSLPFAHTKARVRVRLPFGARKVCG